MDSRRTVRLKICKAAVLPLQPPSSFRSSELFWSWPTEISKRSKSPSPGTRHPTRGHSPPRVLTPTPQRDDLHACQKWVKKVLFCSGVHTCRPALWGQHMHNWRLGGLLPITVRGAWHRQVLLRSTVHRIPHTLGNARLGDQLGPTHTSHQLLGRGTRLVVRDWTIDETIEKNEAVPARRTLGASSTHTGKD